MHRFPTDVSFCFQAEYPVRLNRLAAARACFARAQPEMKTFGFFIIVQSIRTEVQPPASRILCNASTKAWFLKSPPEIGGLNSMLFFRVCFQSLNDAVLPNRLAD